MTIVSQAYISQSLVAMHTKSDLGKRKCEISPIFLCLFLIRLAAYVYCYKSDGKSHLHSKQEKLCKDTSQAKILEAIHSIAQKTSMDNLSTRKQVSLCCVLADLFQAMGDFSVPFHCYQMMTSHFNFLSN